MRCRQLPCWLLVDPSVRVLRARRHKLADRSAFSPRSNTEIWSYPWDDKPPARTVQAVGPNGRSGPPAIRGTACDSWNRLRSVGTACGPFRTAGSWVSGLGRRGRPGRPRVGVGSQPRGSTITLGRMEAWTFIWLMLILKIPIVGLFLIVRWAVRQGPEPTSEEEGGIGPASQPLHPFHPRARLPRNPRRGPHGEPPLVPPARVRTAMARARFTPR